MSSSLVLRASRFSLRATRSKSTVAPREQYSLVSDASDADARVAPRTKLGGPLSLPIVGAGYRVMFSKKARANFHLMQVNTLHCAVFWLQNG